ncbi:MAG TPA: hypothetical protein VFO65_11845, partial [Acidimicrobiales bacterium]|nr:hypothetical protein [Acidimicrobiales bacterium]
APQLPRRGPRESMLGQVSAGMAGVAPAPDGTLVLEGAAFAATPPDEPLDPDAWAATIAFLRAAGAAGRTGPVKLQLTGPVTLAVALALAGGRAQQALAAAEVTVVGRVRALVAAARALAPGVPLVVVLDEPGLPAWNAGGPPRAVERTIDVLSSSMAAAGPSVLVGVHCCAPADWRVVMEAGPDLVSLPVDRSLGDDDAGFAAFLDRGGLIAWGVVPTDRPMGQTDELQWRRLMELWAELSSNGCDPGRLRAQSVLTPACGLALHDPAQVEPVYARVRRIADRLRDQLGENQVCAGA